ncbi:protein of unknown function [Pseudodesulfovibrio profundus]|uniref:Uncharacterized protein n=1 Tax=Pseudodesulfovibrio profundus TaxID=57320 RepID=A0A2C8F6A5_9BACT|nr:protein of unknown function [Pseudodesulfovibrio profundus]
MPCSLKEARDYETEYELHGISPKEDFDHGHTKGIDSDLIIPASASSIEKKS